MTEKKEADTAKSKASTSEIDRYKAVIIGGPRGDVEPVAMILCFKGKRHKLTCEYYRDEFGLPPNGRKGHIVHLSYPWAQFSSMIDILRNEAPIHFSFVDATGMGYISTLEEPVGEGPEDADSKVRKKVKRTYRKHS